MALFPNNKVKRVNVWLVTSATVEVDFVISVWDSSGNALAISPPIRRTLTPGTGSYTIRWKQSDEYDVPVDIDISATEVYIGLSYTKVSGSGIVSLPTYGSETIPATPANSFMLIGGMWSNLYTEFDKPRITVETFCPDMFHSSGGRFLSSEPKLEWEEGSGYALLFQNTGDGNTIGKKVNYCVHFTHDMPLFLEVNRISTGINGVVTLVDRSIGDPPSTRQWTFDGLDNTGKTNERESVSYGIESLNGVSLTITNESGNGAGTDTDNAYIDVFDGVTVDFDVSDTSGVFDPGPPPKVTGDSPLSITFRNQSSGMEEPDEWLWYRKRKGAPQEDWERFSSDQFPDPEVFAITDE